MRLFVALLVIFCSLAASGQAEISDKDFRLKVEETELATLWLLITETCRVESDEMRLNNPGRVVSLNRSGLSCEDLVNLLAELDGEKDR